MFVNVRDTIQSIDSMESHERPPHLAIVVTLASIALFTSLLRAYTLGSHVRALGTDDGLAFLAMLSLIGLLAVFLYSTHTNPGSFEGDSQHAILLATKLLHVLGLGFVKVSVVFFLLVMAIGKTFRRVLFVLAGFLTLCTLFWFFSILFRCMPVGDWRVDQNGTAGRHCMSPIMFFGFAVANNTTNVVTEFLLITLILFLAGRLTGPRPTRALMLVPLCFALVACASAIVRTRIFFIYGGTLSQLPDPNQTSSLVAWGIMELSCALAAVNLFLLALSADAFLPCLYRRRVVSVVSTPRDSLPPSYHASHSSRFSSTTVIYRPGTAYFPSESRFHDVVSNLDFDIETAAMRRSTPTIVSEGAPTIVAQDNSRDIYHARHVSDWSQFSGFTYSASTTEAQPEPDKSLVEMGEIIKELAGSEDRPEGHEVTDEKATMGTCTTSVGRDWRETIIRTRSAILEELDAPTLNETEYEISEAGESDGSDALSFIDIPRTRDGTSRYSAHLDGDVTPR